MIAADKIAEVLTLPRPVATLAELSAAVARGLPKSALRSCVQRVATSPQERRHLMHRIVPEATYKRRRHHLKLEESERTERLARVIATAEYVWDDPDDARRFLTTPHPALGGRRPIDAAYTELGAREAEELLWQIYHGLPV
jgi:putative toxin-antitoxin system antitoxin component (TIGR02293 family)